MIRVDEEFRDLVPPLSDAERAGLEADIVRDGRATVALTVWGDVLLDGHNRFAICTAHALPFTTQAAPDWIATRDDAKLWILQTSLNRRNLDALTRIDLVRRMEPLLAARAKAKQAAQGECGAEGGRGRAKETLGKNSSQGFGRAPRARDQAAAAADVSHPTYTAGKAVLTLGTPELIAAVRKSDIAISTAAEIAALPAERQREIVADGPKAARRAAAAVKQAKSRERIEAKRALAAAINEAPPPPPTGPFNVIVIDPPWRYDTRAEDPSHAMANPYPDMSVAEICALPVSDLACATAVLWLWTTNAFLRDAYACLDAWGFRERTVLTWIKDRAGLGEPLRGQTEHAILAVRGRPPFSPDTATTALHAKRREHSRKPDEFYALVEALCPGSRLEMFAREPRAGWASWGAESEKFHGG